MPRAEKQEAEVALERLMGVAGSALVKGGQLQHALDSRIVIEQAKGVLAERFGIGVDDAFQLLRSGARSNRIRIHELAARVVESRETPPEIDAPTSPSR
jgi:AmiR/NasT family two-component response regulator